MHTGAYGGLGSMSGHLSSMSGYDWTSEQGDENNTQDHTAHSQWIDTFQTPPPQPTQETQYDEHGSQIPARNVGPPHRYGWTPPNPPPPRQGRRR
jgi:hypothetical protein